MNPEISFDWANRDVLSIALGIVFGILTFLVGRWIARLLSRYTSRSLQKSNVEPLVVQFSETLVYVAVMAAVVIAALSQAGVHTTSLTALLASAGLAIGLAVKDLLTHLASGVMVMLIRPYTLHHEVEAGGTAGFIEEVQLFHTVLRTSENVKVIVPNGAMLSGKIVNYSAYDQRRINLAVTVPSSENINTVRSNLLEVIKQQPLARSEPEPTVEVTDLTPANVSLSVRVWVATGDYAKVRGELLEAIKPALYGN